MKLRVELENALARNARRAWGENAVEALVGSLSSIITEEQLITLVAQYAQKGENK